MKDINTIQHDDGRIEQELVFNPDIAWFKGHMVNRPFGRCALKIKEVEHLGNEALFHMSPARAMNLREGLLNIVERNKRSIDAKSSETYKDENNNQSSLIQMLNKDKQEKLYTVKGDAKKSIMDGILGRDSAAEED